MPEFNTIHFYIIAYYLIYFLFYFNILFLIWFIYIYILEPTPQDITALISLHTFLLAFISSNMLSYVSYSLCQVKWSQGSIICIALLTMQIVSKQLYISLI